MVPAEELPKRHRVVIHVDDPDQTAEESIKFLSRQNVGLDAGRWLVVKGSESRDAKSSHFAAMIPEQSLAVLKSCNFRPHCGLSRASVKPVEKRSGDKGRETVDNTSGSGGGGSA